MLRVPAPPPSVPSMDPRPTFLPRCSFVLRLGTLSPFGYCASIRARDNCHLFELVPGTSGRIPIAALSTYLQKEAVLPNPHFFVDVNRLTPFRRRDTWVPISVTVHYHP